MSRLRTETKSEMNFKVKPWAHQLEVIERAKDLPGFGLFFDPRTGKSSTTINLLRYKFNTNQRIFRTLIEYRIDLSNMTTHEGKGAPVVASPNFNRPLTNRISCAFIT